MLIINFVTTNSRKFAVAQHFFSEAGMLDKVTLRQYDQETPEIQANSVEDVARHSAEWAGKQLGQAVVVADAGLEIRALKGFPGPYMKYLNDTLTPQDMLVLMEDKTSRKADFVDALAYYDPHTNVSGVFKSITPGSIATEVSTTDGSTVDRLFVPDGWEVPLADLSSDARVKVWNTNRWQELTAFLQTSAKHV